MGRPLPVQSRNRPVVVGLQPVALIDHVARIDWTLLEDIPGERGGSLRVTEEEVLTILEKVKERATRTHGAEVIKKLAGGSVANTIRGLSGGLKIPCSIVGARGDDNLGRMFQENLEQAGVDLSGLRVTSGSTGQCVCLVDDEGNRTMRPCLSDASHLRAEEITSDDFKGAKWLVLNGYGFYWPNLTEKAVELAKEEGARVALDLASFEVVRRSRTRLLKLLESRKIDLCFANEDEARELMKTEGLESPEECLEFLGSFVETAVVMLGPKGCMARRGREVTRVAAVQGIKAIDTTGAGDLFACGFLYGMINGLSLEACCRVGCCTGAGVVLGLGGEIDSSAWDWVYTQLQYHQLPVRENLAKSSQLLRQESPQVEVQVL
ncbi:hypothetical protein R1sor_026012 [Riccia sorocarpa]|uniref:Carbohydrate kinase PfkB domain-containing protein n=1 Tax=Riccia sorocarpa TaxID=122646 RepID=A0ABD3GC97_9MARC